MVPLIPCKAGRGNFIGMEEMNWKKGRGAQINTHNRFHQLSFVKEHDEGIDDWEEGNTVTQFFKEDSKTVVNKVSSPDVHMLYSLNPYQGCEHGCIYCYARNSHEYWGFSAGTDFESKIVVKDNAPELLRKFFNKKSWSPAPISLSGNTDCYQPVERKLKITRKLLEVCLEFGNPVGVITKNVLVLRDLDIIQELAKKNLVAVYTSITSLDEDLRQALEPRTTTYKSRLKIVETLARHDIHTGIMNAPIIPAINDHHSPMVLKAAAESGAKAAGYTIVRLNGAINLIFKDWLYKAFPDRADKVWHHIEQAHGGKVNDSRFGTRMMGEGPFSEIFRQQFKLHCRKYGLNNTKFEYDLSHFRRPGESHQLSLF